MVRNIGKYALRFTGNYKIDRKRRSTSFLQLSCVVKFQIFPKYVKVAEFPKLILNMVDHIHNQYITYM